MIDKNKYEMLWDRLDGYYFELRSKKWNMKTTAEEAELLWQKMVKVDRLMNKIGQKIDRQK